MKEALRVSLDAWQKYWGNGFYEYLLLVAVVYFLIFGRKKERAKLFLIYVTAFLGIFFCPVTAWVIQKCVGGLVYWRVLWLIPMVPLIGYAGTCLIQKAGEKPFVRWILLAAVTALLVLCGKGLDRDGFFQKVHNVQKIPDEIVGICDLINSQRDEEEEIYLATDDKVASYVRICDPTIKMPYGRGRQGAKNKAARLLHDQLVAETPVIKKVVKYAKKLECNYLVFPLPSEKKQIYMEGKGFHLIGQVNGYGIFKYSE